MRLNRETKSGQAVVEAVLSFSTLMTVGLPLVILVIAKLGSIWLSLESYALSRAALYGNAPECVSQWDTGLIHIEHRCSSGTKVKSQLSFAGNGLFQNEVELK